MDRYAQTAHPMPTAAPTGRGYSLFTWALVALALAWTVVVMPLVPGTNAAPMFVLVVVFSALHGIRRYGVRGMVVFAVMCWVISNALENCSILTGFPFGHYHYTLGPSVFLVPVGIGIAYIGLGYVSWQVSNAVLGEIDQRLKQGGARVWLAPVMAAFIMTMTDVVTDPGASTIAGIWVWEQGGGYFGVPWTNFLGWWLVTYLFFQAFALYLRHSPRAVVRPEASNTGLLQAAILYLNVGVQVAVHFVLERGGSVYTDAAGTVWRGVDIAAGTFTVFLFTMCPIVVLALARTYRLDRAA